MENKFYKGEGLTIKNKYGKVKITSDKEEGTMKKPRRWEKGQSVKEFVDSLGYKLVYIDRIVDFYTPKVLIECKEGHRVKRSINYFRDNKNKSCHICYGRILNKEKVNSYFTEKGIKARIDQLPDRVDEFGNEMVLANDIIDVECSKGHGFRSSVSRHKINGGCHICEGKGSTSFSKSEEIISRVLDENNITYERERTEDVYGSEHAFDFYLPNLNMYLEYDGSHHVYGRSDNTEEKLKRTIEVDKSKDSWVKDQECFIERIDHNYQGKGVVFALSATLNKYGTTIDATEKKYDDIVREITDKGHEWFGWNSYKVVKRGADWYTYYSVDEIRDYSEVSCSRVLYNFRYIHGMSFFDLYNCQSSKGAMVKKKQLRKSHGINWK